MQPEDNSLEQPNGGPVTESSLEAPVAQPSVVTAAYSTAPTPLAAPGTTATGMTVTPAPKPLPPKKPRFAAFRSNRKLLSVTAAAIAGFIVIGGVAGLLALLGGHKAPTAASKLNNYSVGSLSVKGVKTGSQLKIGEADQLAINGQLEVANTIVVNPTNAPKNAVKGQIYYDSKTNQPYYYDGSKFISMAQVPPPDQIKFNSGNGIEVNGTTITNKGVITTL